jgi:hypothetical protein
MVSAFLLRRAESAKRETLRLDLLLSPYRDSRILVVVDGNGRGGGSKRIG